MVEVYAKLVLAGRRTIDDVPGNLRKQVEARVKELTGDA